jgi:hypothetical protein
MPSPKAPDKFIEFCYAASYRVADSNTVRSGFSVKFAGSQPTNKNHLAIVEAALVSDKSQLGIARGPLPHTFAAGEEVIVTHYFNTVERAMAGTGGVTIGDRVIADSTGFITAPAFASGGATLVQSPGIALDTCAINEAFPMGLVSSSWIAT